MTKKYSVDEIERMRKAIIIISFNFSLKPQYGLSDSISCVYNHLGEIKWDVWGEREKAIQDKLKFFMENGTTAEELEKKVKSVEEWREKEKKRLEKKLENIGKEKDEPHSQNHR